MSRTHRAPECQVAISSTWRLEADKRKQFVALLEKRFIHVAGDTQDFMAQSRGDRGDEILQFVQDYEQAIGGRVAWIAIDDLDLLGMNPKLDPLHIVKTNDDEVRSIPVLRFCVRMHRVQSDNQHIDMVNASFTPHPNRLSDDVDAQTVVGNDLTVARVLQGLTVKLAAEGIHKLKEQQRVIASSPYHG